MADAVPPAQTPAPSAPKPAGEGWLGKNGIALLSAVFSFAGAFFAGWVTIQTHSIDSRVAELQQRNANAQNFEQRVFENVDKLLNKNHEASRLYLIGLYGQARDDPANKVMVASIAAASCNKDLLATLQTLINSNDKDKRQFQEAGFGNSLDAWNSLCVVSVSSPPPGSRQSKVVEATPAPETVKARTALIASLTPVGSTGWMKLGFAPLGTEAKACVEVTLDPPATMKVLDPTAACQPSSTAKLFLPRDINERAIRLQTLAPGKLYATAADTSTATGIATPNSVVKLKGNVKGVDMYDARGQKTGYSVWANVELQPPVVSDIPTVAATPTAVSSPAATASSTPAPKTATPQAATSPKPQTTP